MPGQMAVRVGAERLVLLPQRAVWWPRRDTLFVADVHIGKAAAFRQLGVPVPVGTTDETLFRLQRLVADSGARHLVVLGDLFHSEHVKYSASLDAFAAWRARNAALQVTLVRGNHDVRSGDPSAALNIASVDAPADFQGLYGLHEPDPDCVAPSLAGHVHPAIRLSGRGGDRLRLPCFVLRDAQLTLPAFGAFTGMHTLQDVRGLTVYPLTEQGVHRLPAAAAPQV